MNIKQFIMQQNISIDVEQVQKRPDGIEFGATHWKVTMTNDMRKTGGREVTEDFFYSMGSALTGPPELEDVLFNILLDAQAGEMSLDEFFEEYGYDSPEEAIRVLDACRDNREKVYNLFGYYWEGVDVY